MNKHIATAAALLAFTALTACTPADPTTTAPAAPAPTTASATATVAPTTPAPSAARTTAPATSKATEKTSAELQAEWLEDPNPVPEVDVHRPKGLNNFLSNAYDECLAALDAETCSARVRLWKSNGVYDQASLDRFFGKVEQVFEDTFDEEWEAEMDRAVEEAHAEAEGILQ